MTYDRVNWQNEPSENTPLSAENLNKMDSAIKELSEMVVANPVEASTDELKKVEIEGTVYKIAGGHELVNASGSTMTQRSKMSFPDSHLTDDSGNNQTIVDIIKEVTTAQWNNATEEGLYYINDKPDSIITAEQVAYDNDNSVKDMLEISSITISERNANVNVLDAFKVGKLVVLDFYDGSDTISANTVWFRVDESARPSSAKTTMAWLQATSSSFGSRTFTIDTDGRITCNGEVFRGGVKLIYTI